MYYENKPKISRLLIDGIICLGDLNTVKKDKMHPCSALCRLLKNKSSKVKDGKLPGRERTGDCLNHILVSVLILVVHLSHSFTHLQ